MMLRSLMADVGETIGIGFRGLYLAAASLAAMFEGEGVRSPRWSSGTPRVLELLDLL
jgi:hypothetical protein